MILTLNPYTWAETVTTHNLEEAWKTKMGLQVILQYSPCLTCLKLSCIAYLKYTFLCPKFSTTGLENLEWNSWQDDLINSVMILMHTIWKKIFSNNPCQDFVLSGYTSICLIEFITPWKIWCFTNLFWK